MSGESPDGLPPLRDVIRDLGLTAVKSLGQNFILDLNLTRRIARATGPLAGATVVEIGPGPGGLTRGLFLEGAAKVIVVERDERCTPALEAIAARYPGRLQIHMADAVGFHWPLALARAGVTRARIVANLPYNVASQLLVGWLETEPWPPWFDRMALMFQREVADRIVATPRTKAYGRLSVLTQWRATAKLALTLPAAAFTPPPKVESAVVEIVPRPDPQPPCSVITLGRVTAAGFGQRRKMLRQSLKTLGKDPEQLLSLAGIAPERRAEELTPGDFARLARILDQAPLERVQS